MGSENLRRSYREDPKLLTRLVPMLDVVFPGISQTIEGGRALGLEWERSTPFVYEIGGEIVSHVGVIEMCFVMDGEEHDVAIVHGVATHPEHRRRGYYRAVMEEALAWCDERYATVVLNTGNPEYYTAFGFRHAAESRFVLEGYAAPTKTWAPFRPLDYTDSEDVARMRALVEVRTPLSHRLGVVRESQAFVFNTLRRPPHSAQDLDALICLNVEGSTLQLFDVVARELPSLEEIVARVEADIDRIECYFATDRFEAPMAAERHVLFGDEFLMVRGPFPPEGGAFLLPQPARC